MKTIRTVQSVVERDEVVSKEPAFEAGDYVEIYYGSGEGCCFWIKEVRYNHDRHAFEYGGRYALYFDWYSENQLVLLKRKEAS